MGVFAVLAVAVTLAVPGRTNAHVSLAADGAFVVATWAGTVPNGPTDIFAAVSRDGGETFAAPVRVNAKEGDARANGEQPPHVALVKRGAQPPSIVIVWTARREAGSVLLSARSDDAGRTFSASDLVPGSDAAGNRGWEAIAVDARGVVRVLWLDHRELAPSPSPSASAAAAPAAARAASATAAAVPAASAAAAGAGGASAAAADGGAQHTYAHHAGASPSADGVAMAQKSKLYLATVGDAASPKALTGGVCYCCKTALVTGSGDSVFAAWRHVYPGSERDIAFSVSRDNGRTFAEPVRVSPDRWLLNGCPDDGPTMAVDARGRVHIAWPSLIAGEGGAEPGIGLFYASSADGRAFTARERVATEAQAHHPQMAIGRDGSVNLVWDESGAGGRRIVLARGPAAAPGAAAAAASSDKAIQFQREVLSADAPAAYPVLAVSDRGLLAAWTSGAASSSTIHIERVAPPAQRTSF